MSQLSDLMGWFTPTRGATITHQACVCPPGRPVTLCYSRWTDGRVSKDEATYIGDGMAIMGQLMTCIEPPGLNWVETGAKR